MSSSKPRILRIINRLNLGGPTYNAAYLTRYLSPDFETMLAAGMKDESEESSEYIVENLGIKPVYIPSMKRELHAGDDIKSYRFIRKLIADFKPDIVHTHAAKAGTLGRLAASHAGVPVIVHTFHGHVFHSYFSPLKTKIFLNIERYLARKSTAIIAISSIQKEELANTFKVCAAEKINVVPLGFDLSRFYTNQETQRQSFRMHYNLSDEMLAIGIIGRLVPIKNHQLFLESIRNIKHQSKRPVRAFIIGDGEDRTKLEGLCDELSLSYRAGNEGSAEADVTFTSWIKNVEWALAGIDIVALTSNNEGTPVSLIEAQAAGKPIVSTDTGGIADVVLPDETAILVPPGDTDAFSRQLLKLVNDEQMQKDYSKKGADFVREKFHYQRLVNDMGVLYNRLLNR